KFRTGFGRGPRQLRGTVGLLSSLLGFLGLAYLGVTWISNLSYPESEKPFLPLHQRPLMIYALAALLLGAQLMSIGFLAELLIAYHGRDADSYSIAEETSPGPPRDPEPPHA